MLELKKKNRTFKRKIAKVKTISKIKYPEDINHNLCYINILNKLDINVHLDNATT